MGSDVKGGAPREEDLAEWHRWSAIECNNAAWQWVESAAPAPAETAAMHDAAHAAAWHWNAVGTPLNRARANMLLAFAHAYAGSGTLAIQFAGESLDDLSALPCPDWGTEFLYACMAPAAYAAGDLPLHAEHYAQARRHGDSIAGETDPTIFETSFQNVAIPAG
jgi:hypothetical protein